MKISIPKMRLANIIIWIAAILFFFVFWGIINSLTVAYPGRIIVICINSVFCTALFCWTIFYGTFLKKERKNNRLPWDSWFLYASLFFLYFGVSLTAIFVLFQIQKIFIAGIFIALWLACVFARLIFNIFSKSGFFTDVEENIALFVAILFGIFIVAMYFQSNILAASFAKVLMGCVSVLFITLMIKKFLIEQAALKSLEAIMNFIFLFLATIATSIATIYLLFWKQGAESQDLFNSMMGVFAGILGGVLTLAGVAWTIKREATIRQEEELKKNEPIFSINIATKSNYDLENKKICFDKKNIEMSNVFVGIIENSNHSVIIAERLFHDGKWYELTPNKVILPNKEVYLDFTFDDAKNIILEIHDVRDNRFYYELDIVYLRRRTENRKKFYTIAEVKKINKNMLFERGIEVD